MSEQPPSTCRYFSTYSGVKLPLNLVGPIPPENLQNRNTYFRAYFDAHQRMILCQKIVYGDVELEHRYEYDDAGCLTRAEITEAGDEPKVMSFGA